MAYKPLKLWFDDKLAVMLADKLLGAKVNFTKSTFVQQVTEAIPPLELKDRVAAIAALLDQYLHGDFTEKAAVLTRILGPENAKETEMFTRFYWLMPIAKWVEDYGLEHFEVAMSLIAEITKRNTGEFAIRPYLRRYPARTLTQMMEWAKADNRHLRRLASEGGRPRLPWATKLQPFIADPRPLLPILHQLRDDDSKYVQKSVANCLNDIMKDNEVIGRELVESWLESRTPPRTWIIRHGLRSLRKKEVAWAIALSEELA